MTTYHQDEAPPSGRDDHAPSTTPVIGFDMGGTSTDVSRYDGEYEHVFESTMAGVTIQAPQVCTLSSHCPTHAPVILQWGNACL